VDLRFLTDGLQGLCNSRAALVRRWGEEQGNAVSQRLHELDAADCLGDLADLPFTTIATEGAKGTVEIRDSVGLVIVGHVNDVSDDTTAAEAWRRSTSLTISDVFVSVTAQKGASER
jgi:hypothetical protein